MEQAFSVGSQSRWWQAWSQCTSCVHVHSAVGEGGRSTLAGNGPWTYILTGDCRARRRPLRSTAGVEPPWRWAAWARATSRASSSSGTTFWVPAGRSRSWTSPWRQLVADDDREVGAARARPTRAACRASGGPARPGRAIPAARRSVAMRSRVTVSSGSAPTTTAAGAPIRRSASPALLVEREDEPVEADPEPDPRRRLAAEELDQAVVPTAAAERLLLALRAGDVELERGPRVVVEAADEARLEAVRDAQRVEVGADAAKCSAQASHSRSVMRGAAALSVGHRRVLGVEQAQDVAFQSVALDRRQRSHVVAVVRGQLRDVGRPAGRVADRVEQDLDAAQTRHRRRSARRAR